MKNKRLQALPSGYQVTQIDPVSDWKNLTSNTNWEKGKIISLWRVSTGKTIEDFVREVGGITECHAWRLYKVWTKYSRVRKKFTFITWSHFHRAIDWPDDRKWLLLAEKRLWPVSHMALHRFNEGEMK